MDIQAIETTDFKLPGQTGLYRGKVRDVYSLDDGRLVSVATDRISAFDAILPRGIPYKGQVLNQLAAHFLEATAGVAPNWLRAMPDSNASIGLKAEPFKVEVVVRGALVGHAWREYQSGKRTLCGAAMPDGLKEYDAFPEPIITPTTKADEGHDEDIDEASIIKRGLATEVEWQQLKSYATALFGRGQEMAAARGLVLADTKYEFGKLDGKIIVIDEVHTPDSSRYFYAEGYQAYVTGASGDKPKHLSKEFVREWLLENGFDGRSGAQPPEMTNDFVKAVSERYIELYEQLTGQAFEKNSESDSLKRIENNLITYLEEHYETD